MPFSTFLLNSVQIVMATAHGQVTPKEAAVMAKLMSEVKVEDSTDVQTVADIATSLDPKTSEAEVEVMVEKAKELSKVVKEEVIKEVAQMVEEVGPVVSAREFKMIEKMAKAMDSEITKKDVKILSQACF